MAKQTVSAPAPKAPAKALAPPAPKAPPKAPKAPGQPAVMAPPVAPKAPGPDAATLAELSTLRETVQALTATIGALKAKQATKTRTPEQITEGIEIPAGDWRADYHGFTIRVFRANDRSGELVLNDPPSVVDVLCAIPRDNDLGNDGPNQRNRGMLALHWSRTEDGASFAKGPMYVNAEELALMWSPEQP